MAFWQVFVLFSLLSAAFVMWPFVRTQKLHKFGLRTGVRSDIRDAIIEDRKNELLAAKNEGELSENEFSALERDLSQTMHSQERTRPDDPERAVTYGSKSKLTVLVLTLLIPMFALFVYSTYGAKADWEIADELASLPGTGENMEANARELQSDIIRRLDKTPDNGNLWFLLGNLSAQLGDFEESVRAYRYLKSLFPESAVVNAELAQSLFLRAGNVVTPEVREHTRHALDLDPEVPTALGLAGIDAFQKKEYKAAIDYWKSAIQRLAPESAASQVLSEGVVRAEAALGIQGSQVSAETTSVDGSSITVRVSLSPEVSGLQGNETLFVYARAWQGPRMPLAIQRLPASGFPLEVSLDSSMAMAEGMDIRSVAQLELIARISRSGNAVPQSGDWTGSFGPVILGEKEGAIELVISEQTP
jgi:cytochrome c-type biogenesis protein CcmH